MDETFFLKNNRHNAGIQILDIIKEKSDISFSKILDLGAGDPGPFLCLYNNYPFEKYVAVDAKHYFSINFPWPDDEPYPDDFVDSELGNKDIYKEYLRFQKYCGSKYSVLNRSKFFNVFEFKNKTDVRNYLAKTNELFDLIVISNFLHLDKVYENAKEILRSALSRLNKNKFLFLKVYVAQDRVNSHTRFFNEDEINDFKSNFSFIVYEERRGNQFMFLGKK